jgi:tetratricopeptide (TPR) repeat protein
METSKFISCSTIGLLFLTFIISCSKQTRAEDRIVDRTESIVEQQPDSALTMLNSILFPEDLSKNMFNKYNLLLVRAKDKCYKDIIGDTIIFAVKDYFVRQKDDRNAAYAAFYCARVLHEQKNEVKAFTAYETAIDMANKIQDYNLMGLANGNLGILYREHSLNEMAITAAKKAVEIFRKTENHQNEISVLSQIADCFLLENKTDSAFCYNDESIKLADYYKLKDLQSSVRQNEGVAYRKKGDNNQAKRLFREALTFGPDSASQARILMNIAKVYLSENRMDSVKYYLDRALAISFNEPVLLRTSYLLLSQTEEKDGDYKQALNHYKEYYNYTLKVFDVEKNNKLMEVQQKYDFEKLKTEKKSIIIRQKNGLLTLSFVLLVACVIIFIIYRKSEQNKKDLLKAEYNINSLQKMAMEITKEYSEEKQTLRLLILQYSNILKKSALIEKNITDEERKNGQSLLKKFTKIVYGQDTMDWKKLFEAINQYHNGFYEKIQKEYPQWKDLEFRICCLSCETDFDDMEISIIIGKSVDTVRRIRSDIRKKLGMAAYDHDIYSFLSQKIASTPHPH